MSVEFPRLGGKIHFPGEMDDDFNAHPELKTAFEDILISFIGNQFMGPIQTINKIAMDNLGDTEGDVD